MIMKGSGADGGFTSDYAILMFDPVAAQLLKSHQSARCGYLSVHLE